MLKLKELQNQFFNEVINSRDNELLQYIKPSNISAKTRFQIYKQTIFENLYSALKITFPGIEAYW